MDWRQVPVLDIWERLSPSNITLGHGQPFEVEDALQLRELTLSLSRVQHRPTVTMRAHILNFWQALTVVRVAETVIRDTLLQILPELDRVRIIEVESSDGRMAQCTAITAAQQVFRLE